MSGASVAFERLNWAYPGGRAVLHELTLEARAGELLVLLGPSGCGKSTLLRMANRLLVPQSGTVRIDGVDAASVDVIALRRSIGYVIQGAGLFPHLTVYENIALVPRLLGWEQARIDARVGELLQLVQLDAGDYARRRPRTLSGGQAQRVAVARALAAQPRVLLMDEPFGALDPVVRRTLQHDLRALIAALGTTTLFVTHDVEEALVLADRIAVMEAGRIVQVAAPLELLAAPATAQVADFVSSSDVLRRLALVRVATALPAIQRSDAPAGLAEIAGDQTLRAALNMMLQQPAQARLRVTGAKPGILHFADIAAAVGAEAVHVAGA